MTALLSVGSTAVSSAKVAVLDSGEDVKSVMYRRYNNGSRILLGVKIEFVL
jgi:hypothetical protein